MKGSLRKISIYPPVMMLSMYFAVFSYMIPTMMEMFSMNYKQVGVISTVQFAGGAIAQLVCFGIFAALNKTRIIFISLAAVTLCLVWVGFNKVAFLLYVLFFFRGFFGNTVNTLSNALVTDVFDRRKEFFVGLYHSLAAGAAVLGPYLALWLGNSFTVSFEMTAVLIGLSTVVFWFGMKRDIKMPLIANRANFGGMLKFFSLLKINSMVLILVMILLCSFIQNMMVLYITSFGKQLSGVDADGALALAMFLAGLFAGSMLYSVIAHKVGTVKIMLVANILSFAALSAMLLCSSAAAVGFLALAGGLFFGANMPGLFVELAKLVPHDSGAVSALLFLGSIIAGLAAPVVVGAIADEIGIRWALLINMAFFIPTIGLLFFWRKRHIYSAA